MQLLDTSTVGFVVVAFVPNLMIMLWAMARMHRDIRVMTAKVGIVESDNRMLDEGLKALADEIRQLRERQSAQSAHSVQDEPPARVAANG
jgi:hypothetical protein